MTENLESTPEVLADGGDCDLDRARHVTTTLTAPSPVTEDPARHVGEIFRRLALASETFPGAAFARIVAAVLVALGRAALVEAERQAAWLRERAAPARPGIRVSATARRVDFDGLDVDPPE